jgi:hypothetical protein
MVAPGYKRIRFGRQVLELRFDGVAGCRRTARGGSSRQVLVLRRERSLQTRRLTVREAARRMGAPETYQIPGSPVVGLGLDTIGDPIRWDDRWVFTVDNPYGELYVGGGLAAAGRVMRAHGSPLGQEAIDVAKAVAEKALGRATSVASKTFALAELAQSTRDDAYIDPLVAMQSAIHDDLENSGWRLASIKHQLPDEFRQRLAERVAASQATVEARARTDSPYGVPYEPVIWGGGLDNSGARRTPVVFSQGLA